MPGGRHGASVSPPGPHCSDLLQSPQPLPPTVHPPLLGMRCQRDEVPRGPAVPSASSHHRALTEGRAQVAPSRSQTLCAPSWSAEELWSGVCHSPRAD